MTPLGWIFLIVSLVFVWGLTVLVLLQGAHGSGRHRSSAGLARRLTAD